MGASHEIHGDGKGAVLNITATSSNDELAAARRYLTRHQAEDLIPILGLDQPPSPDRVNR